MDWALFREHRDNPHACAEYCPHYKGPKPDYDSANYPGLMRANQTTLRLFHRGFFTPQDITETIHAFKKVAAYFRNKGK